MLVNIDILEGLVERIDVNLENREYNPSLDYVNVLLIYFHFHCVDIVMEGCNKIFMKKNCGRRVRFLLVLRFEVLWCHI